MNRMPLAKRAQILGFLVEGMSLRAASRLADCSINTTHAVPAIRPRGTTIQSSMPRDDGYGNQVRDQAVLELTSRKPRIEVFSVIPKGDHNSPKTTKPR